MKSQILKSNGWNLTVHAAGGEVLIHNLDDITSKFVARFKHARPKANASAFVKFLVANFTPAEYFQRRAEGFAPLEILRTKDYVSPNERAVVASLGRRPLSSTMQFMGVTIRTPKA
jgi:hypothetical protein